MRRVVAVLSVVFAAVLALAAPAQAKLIPLEVQITDSTHTVRVPPSDFYNAVNRPGLTGYFGVFDYTNKPEALGQPPLALTVFIWTSRSEDGRVYDAMTPDVVRKSYVVLVYYRVAAGAVGQITSGGESTFTPGRWVRFSPHFVDLVEQALQASPAVAPESAGPYRFRIQVTDVPRAEVFIPTMVMVLIVGLGLVLFALRASRRARRAANAPSPN